MGKEGIEIILSNRLWIPLEAWQNIPKVHRRTLIGRFKKVFVSPKEYCELLLNNRMCVQAESAFEDGGKEAMDELCHSCPNAMRKAVCCFSGEDYVSFYRGDLGKINDLLKVVKKYNKEIEVVDEQVLAPLSKKIRIEDTGDDRSVSQNNLAREFVKKGYGILVAPARFGKTRMACVVASMLNQRTFVLAHQKELLEQFQSNWIKFSSLERKDIKINPSVEEAKILPVSLFTYQHFLNEYGKERLKALKKVPGLVIIDEAHRCAALGFNKVTNSFHAKYRLGITATPNRKDKMSFLIYNTFGPVTAEGGSEMLTCRYKVIKTGVIFNDYDRVPHRRRFILLNQAIVKDEERNGIIVKRAVRNVDKGHKVLIPLKSVAHVKLIANLIRERMKAQGYKDARVCEYSAQIVKGKKREEVSQQIRDGFYDVVVAVESMINVGFDAPKISNLILNAGSYSFNNENRYQLFSRIRTKCEGKKTPLIDILQDECKWSGYSAKGILKQMEEYKFIPVGEKK